MEEGSSSWLVEADAAETPGPAQVAAVTGVTRAAEVARVAGPTGPTGRWIIRDSVE